MESTTTQASSRTRLLRQLNINAQQKLKKIWILQKGVAHFEGLLSWKTRDSPKGFVCSSSLRGIFTAKSSCLTAHVAKTIVN